MCITFASGKVGGIQDQGDDRLDEAVLEILISYFQIFVPGSSLRGICETWISETGLTYPAGAPLLALEHQHVLRGP